MSLVHCSESNVNVSDEVNDTSSESSGGSPSTRSSVLSLSTDEEYKNLSTKYNIDNCTDFHVGPKVFAENCQINWNGENNLIGKKLMLEYVDKNLESSGGKSSEFRCRKAYLYGGILTIWLVAVTGVMVFVLDEQKALKNTSFDGLSSTTTASPSDEFLTTTSYPTTTTKPTSTRTEPPPPTTEQLSTTDYPMTTLKPFPTLISRESWRGKLPPKNSSRQWAPVEYVTVDNLDSDRCSGLVNCSKILRNFENQTKTSLNYNFLIDDSGIIYEARGWNYTADDNLGSPFNIIKFGFIGNYGKSHLTEQQKEGLSGFISQNWMDFKTAPTVKAQCCRDIDTEKGPDLIVNCDLYESKLFNFDTECIADVKNCDNRNWFWRHLTQNKLNCDDSSVFNHIMAVIGNI